MTNQETTRQTQEAMNPAAQEMQRRIDTATPEEVYDGLMLHATEIADRTKAIESTRMKGRDVSETAFMDYMDDAIEFQSTAILYQEWSGISEDERPGFKEYVTELEQQSFDSEGNATVDSQRAGDILGASSWMGSNFDKTMKHSLSNADQGHPPKRPEAEFGLASRSFNRHKAEYGGIQVNQKRKFEQEQVEQAQVEARAATQQEVIVEEARATIEAAHGDQELINNVVSLAKDGTYAHLYGRNGFESVGDLPHEDVRQYQKRSQLLLQNLDQKAASEQNWRESDSERVIFLPVVEIDKRTQVDERVVEKKRFGKDVVSRTEYQVDIPGTERPKMITNPATGKQEPAVQFRYDFNVSRNHAATRDGFVYSGLTDNRGGSVLNVAVELPKSVAEKLAASVEARPELVREVVEALVLKNTSDKVTQTDWEEGDPEFKNPVRPPYELLHKLAPDWKIAVLKPKPDMSLAELASYQAVKSMEVTRRKIAA